MVVAFAVGLARVGCGKARSGKHLIGFSQCNLGEPWRVSMNADVAAAAKASPDIEVAYADAQQDNAKQVADVENFLRQKIDLLIISPNEAKPLTPIVRRVYEQGIPVIVLDRAIEGDTYTVFIGADNREIGKAAGEYIVGVLKGKGDDRRDQGPAGLAAGARPERGLPRGDRRRSRTSRSSTTRSPTGCARRRWRRWSRRWLGAREDRPRLRAQRPDGDGRLPRRQGQGPRRQMMFVGIDAPAGPRRRAPGRRRRQALGDVRLSDRRQARRSTPPPGSSRARRSRRRSCCRPLMITKENALAPPAK